MKKPEIVIVAKERTHLWKCIVNVEGCSAWAIKLSIFDLKNAVANGYSVIPPKSPVLSTIFKWEWQ